MHPLLFPSLSGSPGLIWDRSFIRSRRTINHISVLSRPLAKSVIPVLLVHTMCPDAVVISFTNQFLDRGANHTSVGSDGTIILFTQFPIWKDLFINVWWLRNVLLWKLKPTGPFSQQLLVMPTVYSVLYKLQLLQRYPSGLFSIAGTRNKLSKRTNLSEPWV